jgi:hypothetical protein
LHRLTGGGSKGVLGSGPLGRWVGVLWCEDVVGIWLIRRDGKNGVDEWKDEDRWM